MAAWLTVVAAPSRAAESAGVAGDEPWRGPSFEATVEQPRNVGYLIGDLLQQRIALEIEGDAFEPRALPQRVRVNTWFERRAARIERDEHGRRWLIVDYQVINAPPALAAVPLPAWKIAPAHGDHGLLVADWLVSVGALVPPKPFGTDALDAVRPDRLAAALAPDPSPIRHRLVRWLELAAAVVIVWLAWLTWRNRLSARNLPFALAAREVARLGPTTPSAWQALHRAFDRTAGRALHGNDLAPLFARAPYLAPLRARIEGFYAESAAIFFGGPQPSPGLSLPALTAELRRLERTHER